VRHKFLRSGTRIVMETMVEFTPVYDDATVRSLSSEFARLEGEMLGEGREKGMISSEICFLSPRWIALKFSIPLSSNFKYIPILF